MSLCYEVIKTWYKIHAFKFSLYRCSEANPLAFVAAACGGVGSDGIEAILTKPPRALHERTPLFLGSHLDVAELRSYGDVQQGTAEYTV
jgi:fructose-1,6-bisphosphatase